MAKFFVMHFMNRFCFFIFIGSPRVYFGKGRWMGCCTGMPIVIYSCSVTVAQFQTWKIVFLKVTDIRMCIKALRWIS